MTIDFVVHGRAATIDVASDTLRRRCGIRMEIARHGCILLGEVYRHTCEALVGPTDGIVRLLYPRGGK